MQDEIMGRLAKLERSNKWMKNILLLLPIIFFVAGQSKPRVDYFDSVVTRKLMLVDENGILRGSFMHTPAAGTNLIINDDNQKIRVSIGYNKEYSSLAFIDSGSKSTVSLTTNGTGTGASGSSLTLGGVNDEGVILRSRPGTSSLQLFRGHDIEGITMHASKMGQSSITIGGSDNKPHLSMYYDERPGAGQGASLSIGGETEPRISLSFNSTGTILNMQQRINSAGVMLTAGVVNGFYVADSNNQNRLVGAVNNQGVHLMMAKRDGSLKWAAN